MSGSVPGRREPAKLDQVEPLTIPDELAEAFASNEQARENFEAFPPFSRKAYLHWINNAKREETRRQRITDAVALIARNIKLPLADKS